MRPPVAQLDADTVRMEVDPRNLLEEAEAQLRIGGAWMSVDGVAARCRLAHNRREVAGALIELVRQERAEAQDLDGARPQFRALKRDGFPEHSTPLPAAVQALSKQILADAAERGLDVIPAPPARTEPEVPMPRIDLQTPIIEALRAGPLTLVQLAEKTGFAGQRITHAMKSLRRSGRVTKGEGRGSTFELRAGAAIAPTARNGVRSAPPPQQHRTQGSSSCRCRSSCRERPRAAGLVPGLRWLNPHRRHAADARHSDRLNHVERHAVRHPEARARGDRGGARGELSA